MIFWFSGTGNSKYAAQRMAEALNEPLLCMNDRIKAHDTAAVETGDRLVIVTPTYAWRIPRLVRDWLLQTELRGARSTMAFRIFCLRSESSMALTSLFSFSTPYP